MSAEAERRKADLDADDRILHRLSTRESAFLQWLLLTGNRAAVSGVLLVITFVVFLAGGLLRPVDMHDLISNSSTLQTLFFTLLSGAILLVTIAVSISSVVLSEELTPIGDQKKRIDDSVAFRESIEKFLDVEVSPARPAEFLISLSQNLRRRALAIREGLGDYDEELAEQLDVFVDDVVRQTDEMESSLNPAEFGEANILLATLNYDYSWQVFAARKFLSVRDDDLSDSDRRRLNDMVEILKSFSASREYFKTLYYKRELANLSRGLLYITLPCVVYLSYTILSLNEQAFGGPSVLGLSRLFLFVAFSYMVGLAPFILFTAYVIRAAIVARRTLASGPFVLKRADKQDRLTWE